MRLEIHWLVYVLSWALQNLSEALDDCEWLAISPQTDGERRRFCGRLPEFPRAQFVQIRWQSAVSRLAPPRETARVVAQLLTLTMLLFIDAKHTNMTFRAIFRKNCRHFAPDDDIGPMRDG